MDTQLTTEYRLSIQPSPKELLLGVITSHLKVPLIQSRRLRFLFEPSIPESEVTLSFNSSSSVFKLSFYALIFAYNHSTSRMSLFKASFLTKPILTRRVNPISTQELTFQLTLRV